MRAPTLVVPEEAPLGEGLTAGLAKGVCLFDKDVDLSEEGMGFGVPVVVSSWRTYLSQTAPTVEASADGRTVKKVFKLDAVQLVEKTRSRGVWPYVWLEAKGAVYKSLPWAQRWLIDKRATGNLTPSIGFAPVQSLAEVSVIYRLGDGVVDVDVDLGGLNGIGSRARAYVLNEQGGRAFPVYHENEQVSAGEHTSGWSRVSAGSAGFASADNHHWFRLKSLPDVGMFRGREVVEGQLSWSGIEYDVSRYPDRMFRYRVLVGSGMQQ